LAFNIDLRPYLKNVLAIAAGIVEGLELGNNAMVERCRLKPAETRVESVLVV